MIFPARASLQPAFSDPFENFAKGDKTERKKLDRY